MERWVLAGDVGGTKTDLGLYRATRSGPPRLERTAAFVSRDFDSLEEVVRAFLGTEAPPLSACVFGVAGPVIGGRVDVTNLPWSVDARALAAATATSRLELRNDLETTALGALVLEDEALLCLAPGTPRAGHRAVIAAGTGLGQAILFWDGTHLRPTATEGGHASFAPRDARELELLRFLIARFGRVSWERVLSGPGLVHLFEFLRDVERAPVASGISDRLAREDPAAVIGEAGVSGTCATCRAAVELFVSLYGAQAANLALTSMALGGLYVGGGIVTKLLPVVRSGLFLDAFRAGGRFEGLLTEIPVHVLLDPCTSRRGAAHAARDLAFD